MLSSQLFVGAFTCNGFIYVFGGNDGEPTAEFYHPANQAWTNISWPIGLPAPQKDGLNFYFAISVP